MAMGITLAEAIEYFNSELGAFSTDEEGRKDVIREVHEALGYLLLNGGGNILREWRVTVKEGRFTLPRDLGTPLKFKFSRLPSFGFGTFTTEFFSYSSNGLLDSANFYAFEDHVEIKANRVATQFQPPSTVGLRLLATTNKDDDVGKAIMISGKQRGFDIAPNKDGVKTSGEVLTIAKEGNCDACYSKYTFDDITAVAKDKTCDWVMLTGVTDDCNADKYFLSHYHPDEEIPMYREAELFGVPAHCRNSCMHILGRVDPNHFYTRDKDVLPISSRTMLKLLSKRAKYVQGGDFKELTAVEGNLQRLIRNEVGYFGAPKANYNYNLATSGGSVPNV